MHRGVSSGGGQNSLGYLLGMVKPLLQSLIQIPWKLFDGVKRLCHIRGKMHKKVWIAAGDIILVGLRGYQDDKAYVILKYMPDKASLLKAYGELPENTRLNEGIAGGLDEEDDGPGDDYIEFEDEGIDKL